MAALFDGARRCDHHSRWGQLPSQVAALPPCPPRLVWTRRRLHQHQPRQPLRCKVPWLAERPQRWCPRCCRRSAQALPAQQQALALRSHQGRHVTYRCRRRRRRRHPHSLPAELRGGGRLARHPGLPRHALPRLAPAARRSPRRARPRTGGCDPPLGPPRYSPPGERASERPRQPDGHRAWHPPSMVVRGAAAARRYAGPRPSPPRQPRQWPPHLLPWGPPLPGAVPTRAPPAGSAWPCTRRVEAYRKAGAPGPTARHPRARRQSLGVRATPPAAAQCGRAADVARRRARPRPPRSGGWRWWRRGGEATAAPATFGPC